MNQIGAAVFLVRIICKQRQDGFLRLMQAMDSSGLEVIDVNITTSNGVVLNILIVEVHILPAFLVPESHGFSSYIYGKLHLFS